MAESPRDIIKRIPKHEVADLLEALAHAEQELGKAKAQTKTMTVTQTVAQTVQQTIQQTIMQTVTAAAAAATNQTVTANG